MVLWQVLDAVLNDVQQHCRSKGYHEGPGVNNFVPHDAVAAFGMAKLLATADFDSFLSIAPEGHIYGYFFERLGKSVQSLFVDYPPTRCSTERDLDGLKNHRVLLIEDDIIGGRTLRLVAEHLRQFAPRSIELYLGHSKGVQHLQNVPPEIEKVYLAEESLHWNTRSELEREFVEFFGLP